MQSIVLLGLGLMSCTVLHIGCGTMVRKLMEKDSKVSFIESDNEELQGIREEEEFINLTALSK